MNLGEIDMKNTILRLRDGKAKQMAVASLVAADVDAGDAVITFDAGTVAAEGLAPGMWIAVGALMRPRYFIKSITGEAVTVHRGVDADIAADARLYVSDWNELEIEVGEGNFTWSAKTPRDYKLSRGRLSRRKNGDEEPMDVNIDGIWDKLSSVTADTVPTILEALTRTGEAADWVSAGGECQPYSLDVVVDHRPDCANLTRPNELTIFPDFATANIDGDLENGSLSVPGQCMELLPISIRYADPV